MFSFFKSRRSDPREDAAQEIYEAYGNIINGLTKQIDLLMYFKNMRREDFVSDTYFVRYTFGMFDAITQILPMNLRQRLGAGIVARGFIPFMKKEFGFDDVRAQRLLESVFKIYRDDFGNDSAIMNGGSDGVSRLQGREALRLLTHFGFDSETENITSPQLEEFLRYHQKCNRWREDPSKTSII